MSDSNSDHTTNVVQLTQMGEMGRADAQHLSNSDVILTICWVSSLPFRDKMCSPLPINRSGVETGDVTLAP
jgi:hypothetical protein